MEFGKNGPKTSLFGYSPPRPCRYGRSHFGEPSPRFSGKLDIAANSGFGERPYTSVPQKQPEKCRRGHLPADFASEIAPLKMSSYRHFLVSQSSRRLPPKRHNL